MAELNPSIDVTQSEVQLEDRVLTDNQGNTENIKAEMGDNSQMALKKMAENFSQVGNSKFSEEAAANQALDLEKESAVALCSLETPPKALQAAEIELLFSKIETEREKAEMRIKEVFESTEALNLSFSEGGIPKAASLEEHFIDLPEVSRFYERIARYDMQELISESLGKLTSNLETYGSFLKNPEQLRMFLPLLLNPMFLDPAYMELFTNLTMILAYLPHDCKETLIKWFSKFHEEEMNTVVQNFQQFIMIQSLSMSTGKELHCAIESLDIISRANDIGRVICYTEFYNDAVNTPEMDLRIHYKNWLELNRLRAQGEEISSSRLIDENWFSFCNYSWIMDPSSKSFILDIDSAVSMRQRMSETLSQLAYQVILPTEAAFYLNLKINRGKIVEDTLNQLILDPKVLKKPLKVEFVGEQGIDEGGVKKEFFQLIVKELFDPQYGMFDYFEDVRVFYFNAHTFESRLKFELIGCILGLAIYNRVILDVHFPMVVYRKLAGFQVSVEDLKGLNPDMYQSFQKLLTYTGDVEKDFCFNFQVTREIFGEIKTYDLKPNGGDIPVTAENREEFVELYTNWYLNDVCDEVFQAFYKGFHNVAGGKAFELFKPEELEQLVCGERELDFHDLEKITEYQDGYTKDSDMVKYFWEIVYEFSEEQKRALLAFATGSDRSPIGGLKNMEFFILRHGEDSDRLPTAHTCFNYLLIPEYSSKEKLKERLTLAIENSQGFGLF